MRMSQKKNVVALLQRQISDSLGVDEDASFSENTEIRINDFIGIEWEHPETNHTDFKTPYVAIRTNFKKHPHKELPEMLAVEYFESVNKYKHPKKEMQVLPLNNNNWYKYEVGQFQDYYLRFYTWLEKVKITFGIPKDADNATTLAIVNGLQEEKEKASTSKSSRNDRPKKHNSTSIPLSCLSNDTLKNFTITPIRLPINPCSSTPTRCSKSDTKDVVLRYVSPPPGFAPLYPPTFLCNEAGEIFTSCIPPSDGPMVLPEPIINPNTNEESCDNDNRLKLKVIEMEPYSEESVKLICDSISGRFLISSGNRTTEEVVKNTSSSDKKDNYSIIDKNCAGVDKDIDTDDDFINDENRHTIQAIERLLLEDDDDHHQS